MSQPLERPLSEVRVVRIRDALWQQACGIYRDFSRSDEWASLMADVDALDALLPASVERVRG